MFLPVIVIAVLFAYCFKCRKDLRNMCWNELSQWGNVEELNIFTLNHQATGCSLIFLSKSPTTLQANQNPWIMESLFYTIYLITVE